jgi:predicted MFS family arabinose efflux permease
MSTSRTVAWFVWLLASIFYAYQYIFRVMPNIMANDIMTQFNIDSLVFGQFAGVYYLGYCLAHLPIGIMLDRYGPKKVMSISILLTVIGILPIIFANHWFYAIIGRFLIGVGSSAAILSTFKIIRMTFSEDHFTSMLSFAVTIGVFGALYGGVPVSYLFELYGYKAVIEIFALLGIVFAVLTYFIVPEMESEHKTTIIADVKTVFTNKKVLLVCVLAGLMVGPMEGFADAWGSEFFKQTYGFDTNMSNSLTSMIYFGFLFAPVLSWIAERTGYYLGTVVGAGIMMAAVFIMLVAGVLNGMSITVGLFIVGVCCAYQIIVIYKAATYVPDEVAGLTTAVTNMIIMSFGYVFHTVIGVVIKAYSSDGPAISFTYGVSAIPIALVIGSIGFVMLSYGEKKKKRSA